MKDRISQLMDGELDGRDAGLAIDALRADGEAREAWRTYHLIGDAMQETPPLSDGFSARLAARLAEEPTVLAPPRARPFLERRGWQLLSAAASVAAVAFVLSVAFAPQEGAVPGPQVAQGAAPAVLPADKELAAQVAPPDAAGDYLLAHQGYSPRNSLQGMAPYVRTVSTEARGTGR
jgi:sigma-E factor negative regulatory protein RseA